MDVVKELRGAYVTMMEDAGLAVYDMFLPDDSPVHTYVVMSSQDDSDISDKCENGHKSTVTLDIIHRTHNNEGGRFCDDIAYNIVSLIKAGELHLPAGLQLIASRKTSDNRTSGLSDVFKIYRRILRFEHTVRTF